MFIHTSLFEFQETQEIPVMKHWRRLLTVLFVWAPWFVLIGLAVAADPETDSGTSRFRVTDRKSGNSCLGGIRWF